MQQSPSGTFSKDVSIAYSVGFQHCSWAPVRCRPFLLDNVQTVRIIEETPGKPFLFYPNQRNYRVKQTCRIIVIYRTTSANLVAVGLSLQIGVGLSLQTAVGLSLQIAVSLGLQIAVGLSLQIGKLRDQIVGLREQFLLKRVIEVAFEIGRGELPDFLPGGERSDDCLLNNQGVNHSLVYRVRPVRLDALLTELGTP